jgi:hypothetical protein
MRPMLNIGSKGSNAGMLADMVKVGIHTRKTITPSLRK